MTRVPIPLTLFVAVMLPLVINLGLWQLRRAEEKAGLEQAYQQQLSKPAQSLDDADDFATVSVLGEFAEPLFLVDNQISGGQVGYWVIQVFDVTDGRRILANRGWVKAPALRKQLPDIETPQGRIALKGVIWPQLGLPPLLKEDPWSAPWPIRVQRRDIARMAEMTGSEAVELRLLDGQQAVFRAAPAEPDFKRQTHLGYAVQWFGLGLVLVIGWIVMFRRGKETPDGR